MLRLLWLLAATEAVIRSYTLSDWDSFISYWTPRVPFTTVTDSMICYYINVSQACAGQAFGDLLSLPAIENLATWTPTRAECNLILDKQRLYLETVADRVFSAAIASARTASVSDFDHLAQSWVLRVGHHPLMSMHSNFVAALNGISDWKTVHCMGTDIVYDGTTMAKPDFFQEPDCSFLGRAYVG
jgi:hypothetical protein